MTVHKTLAAALICAYLALLPSGTHASPEQPVIGFSIDDLRVERWTRDRDLFVQAAKALGASVNVQSADGNEEKQIKQVENLIAKKVDVLVIVPMNSKVFSAAVEEAHRAGIKVLSYDRLILNADIDAYISFDNERVGYLQAEALLKARPSGRYYLLGGAPTDNNAKLLRAGQEKALKPAIDAGKVKVVGAQWVKEWSPAEALSIIENVLTGAQNKLDAIVASNDGTAGGAIQALTGQGLAGKVVVSGQDADLAAIKRIKAGSQTVTVYKPLKLLTSEAAKLSLQLVRKQAPAFNAKLDNGKKPVPSVLLTPTALTRENLDLVIKDGFYSQQQVDGH